MSRFSDAPILLTGATGLVGSALCKLLLTQEIPVIALVRNPQKARALLGDHPLLTLLPGDVTQPIISLPCPVGAIIHGANPTSSKEFISDPIGVINACVTGTKNLLELARSQSIDRFLYLSSGEIYGHFETFSVLTEGQMGTIDPMLVRSSYPEAKRLCETLCVAYHAQYQVPTVVVRLGVVFGPPTDPQDNRLLCQFAQRLAEGKDIELHSAGGTVRSYCYVDDVASGILCLLKHGQPGSAYNVANPNLTLSVLEIAETLVAAYPPARVILPQIDDSLSLGYLPELRIQLDCSRIMALGWRAKTGILEGFKQIYSSSMNDRYSSSSQGLNT